MKVVRLSALRNGRLYPPLSPSSLRHLVAFNSLLLSQKCGFRRRMSTENSALKVTNCFLCSNQNMLHAFSCVISQRPNFICLRFGTLCLFLLHKQVGMKNELGQPRQGSSCYRIVRIISEKIWLEDSVKQ